MVSENELCGVAQIIYLNLLCQESLHVILQKPFFLNTIQVDTCLPPSACVRSTTLPHDSSGNLIILDMAVGASLCRRKWSQFFSLEMHISPDVFETLTF